jgi:ribosomal protein S18 acetylase RimI-like enzyme
MTASQARNIGGRIRTFDPFQDLEAVVELIDVAFGDKLDPAGRVTLSRMRRFARGGPVVQWLWLFLGRATAAPGLVWEDQGRIVGNISLRRARSRDGYLIGNVVVHPDWQGQGIGRALMNAAIRRLSGRDAHWVGLEVRADNDVARQLYEDLGFREVGRTLHMLRPGGTRPQHDHPPRGSVRRATSRDADALVELMHAAVPRPQRPLLEVQEMDYRPGLTRALEQWFRGEREAWWVVERNGEICGAARAVRKVGRFPNRLEILVADQQRGAVEAVLVRRGIDSLNGSTKKPIEIQLPLPSRQSLTALEREGFERLRVLIQMKRSLRRRILVDRKMAG